MSGAVQLPTDVHPLLISAHLAWLKLPAMRREYQQLAREAERQQASYLGYLEALLEHEVTQRRERNLQRRLSEARFPYEKRLEDFDFTAVPSLQRTQVYSLAQGAFVKQHENLLLIGPSGLGKTHLLIGLGRSLIVAGNRVLFRTAATLVSELELAQRELRLPKLLAALGRYDLILIDELGYLPFSQQAAQLLFQFFADRYERRSVAVTSNLDFARWTEVFGNEQMTAALLDRLLHRSTVLAMAGESYRFRHSLARHSGAIPRPMPEGGTVPAAAAAGVSRSSAPFARTDSPSTRSSANGAPDRD